MRLTRRYDDQRRNPRWDRRDLVTPVSTPTASGVWRFDGFVLDTQRYELRSGGDVIRVEPQVFDVLTQLVSNHHRFVSKEELFDSVWGGRFVGEAALTSRIKAARRALGDDGESQRYIRTVRGRGYQFVGTHPRRRAVRAGCRRAAGRACAAAPAHRVLPRRRRCAAGLRGGGGGTAAGAGGELDDPPRVRHRKPGVETLGARPVAELPIHPLRRTWLRSIRLGCNGFHVRRLGRRPGVGGGGARTGALPVARRVAGRRRRGGLCGPPSRAGQPAWCCAVRMRAAAPCGRSATTKSALRHWISNWPGWVGAATIRRSVRCSPLSSCPTAPAPTGRRSISCSGAPPHRRTRCGSSRSSAASTCATWRARCPARR